MEQDFKQKINNLNTHFFNTIIKIYENNSIIIKMICEKGLMQDLTNCNIAFKTCAVNRFSDKNINKAYIKDIDLAIETFWNNRRQPLTAVSEVEEHPMLMRTINEVGEMRKLLNVGSTCRRQDMPVIYKVNGSIYINNIIELDSNTSFNDNVIPYVMKRERAIDIDEMEDLYLAEMYMKCEKR